MSHQNKGIISTILITCCETVSDIKLSLQINKCYSKEEDNENEDIEEMGRGREEEREMESKQAIE